MLKSHFYLIFLLLTLSSCGSKLSPERGKYIIGRDATWFPLSLGEKNSNVNGFTNALVQEISQEMNRPLHIYNISWDQLFMRLDQGEFSAVFTSIMPNSENQEKYTFSEPYLLLGPVLVLPQFSSATSLTELGISKIGISQYDDSILILQKYPSIQIELYENMPIALKDLANGELDGVLLSNLEAHSLVPALYNDTLRIASPPLSEKGLRLMTTAKQNEDLIKIFNQGLAQLKNKHRYEALLEKFNVY